MSGTNTLSRSTRGVTLTANQLNALADEALLLDGLTATAAELNILDNATVTATELNLLDGSAALGAAIYRQQTTITSVQLLALAAANITVVAAPGAGLAAVPVGVHLFHDYGGAAYVQTAGGDHLALKIVGGAEIAELGSEAQCTALIEATADAQLYADIGASFVPVANTALALDNNGSNEFTTGTGVLKVTVYYRIVPTA